MKASERRLIREAKEYLESFIECEQGNTRQCQECGEPHKATDMIDFREAKHALNMINNALNN